jgi:outer membrane protein TolC
MIYGQNSSDSVLLLSLDSCLAMAERSSYDIKIAEQLKGKAKAEKAAAFSKYFPTISGNAGYMYMFKNVEVMKNIEPMLPQFNVGDMTITIPIGQTPITIPVQNVIDGIRNTVINNWKPLEISLQGAWMAGVTLQQPIFAGGRIVAGNKMAGIGGELAEENYKLNQATVLLDAQKTYWLYVSVREKVKLAKSYQKLLEELEKLVSNAENVELVNRNDLMKVQVQLNSVKLQVRQAESGLELSQMALCQIIGVDYGTNINPTDTIVQASENKILPPENAVYSRPEYKLMQKQIQMKEGQVDLARGEYLPTLGVGATFGYMGGMKIMGAKQDAINTSNVMAVLSVPISAWWEGSKKIKSANTDKVIAELEMQKNVQLLELQIKQASYNAVNALQNVKDAEFALEQAQESLRISTDRYMVEMETLSDLMTSQSAWQTAYSNLIDARIDYRIKEAEYFKAIGELQ